MTILLRLSNLLYKFALDHVLLILYTIFFFFWNSEDAETLRYQTLSEYDDVESMMKKVSDSDSDTEEREDST